MYYDYLDSVLGRFYLLADEQGLRQLTLASSGYSVNDCWQRNPDFMAPFTTQLSEYLAGTRKEFSLPLAPQGTDFQKQVWQALTEIPYNSQRSFQQIASYIAHPCAFQAIGMARNVNPIPIIIPCHRVATDNESSLSSRYDKPLITLLRQLENGEITLFPADG
ncbi:6-O-methylguanine DNA methyltransferase [Photobacterium aquae]|uniref:6-O-methylguanine DNA methyltransferase n=1 Tax=Photobacterium aquae TaxID=1195763 RepID=A0A0J1HBJ3_9GAMM|nr:methylated-DNA--[protein]-cysteine S-methyltransferase [Photobacterium aquae]KLV09011.1 6-O-methylguanine DNA methyltransferase [Photobacterium aquae]